MSLLLLHANTAVSFERLQEALWEGTPPPSALTKVYGYASALRRALAHSTGVSPLLTRPPGYLLQVTGSDTLDYANFEGLVADGRSAAAGGDHATAASRLGAAIGLWRGQPVADTALSPIYVPALVRLVELRLTVLEELFEAELASGNHSQVVPELAAQISEHPLRERLRAQLMVALHRAGRSAEALESYRTGRRILAADLGIEPSRELQHLQRAILRSDPSLEPHPHRQRWVVAGDAPLAGDDGLV